MRCFGIVGGSGTGKSSCSEHLVCNVRRRERSGSKPGHYQIVHFPVAHRQGAIRVTFQQGALFSSLTVLQNVQLPMLEHLHLSVHERMSSPCSRCGWRVCRPMPVGSFRHSCPRHDQAGRLARALALDPPPAVSR